MPTIYYGEMPSGDQAENVRGLEPSFFYDSARQLTAEYGYAMPGDTANVAKHVVFPDSFTEQNIEGVLGRFKETGRLGSLKSVAGVEVFLDATKAPDLYLWRFWLHDCVLQPERQDTGMLELTHRSAHGYGVFARPDSTGAYFEQLGGYSVDVTDVVWVLGNLTSFILSDPYVKNRLDQMLLNRAEREQHLIEEGVPLDGDPFRLPTGLGSIASTRLLEFQQGFLSLIGYSGEVKEPASLPELADLTTVPLALSGLHSALTPDLATS